jgi:hypothetical protein
MTDHGGSFAPYLDHGQSVEIRGTCESACTLWLGLPADRLCIAPQAWLGFHRAMSKISGVYNREFSDAATRVMWMGYSAKLQARLGQLTEHMVYLRGRDLVAMGYRECHR